MIPMLVHGHIMTKKNTTRRFFFPLILLYLLLLPLYVLVAILFLFLAMIGPATLVARNCMKLFLELPVVFCSMEGTQILIDNEQTDIKLIFE
jgi:hypothetical protein